MQFLKDSGSTPVSFAQLADAVDNGDALPTNPVIISFDDGWENQYENALPVLMRFGYRATFFIFTNGIGARHFMDAGQIRTLAADGMEIGSHSRSHPYLARINDEGTLRAEILGSRLKLEALLGRPVTAFAYPFGHTTPRIVEMVREAGYRSARSTYPGIRHDRRDLFDLTGLIDVTSIAKVEAGVRAAEMAGLPRDLRSGAPRNGPVS
jgi:peptidoglycan/xylan/chitin deacetylase (PgdA/CDA1 family)